MSCDVSKLTNAVRDRVRQFVIAATSRARSDEVDNALRQVVRNDAQWQLLARLTPFDRAHHLQVYRLLTEQGADDPDLLLAAVLHDVGKADGRMRVALPHRVIKVLLAASFPEVLARIARMDTWLGHGLYLAMRHPELGALLARDAGATERCCDLIRLHDKPVEQVDDPALRVLILADKKAGG